MNKREFVQKRRPDWTKFRTLLDRLEIEKSKQIKASELAEFSRLLREVSNDLAVIRSREWGEEIADFLNALVTRGYNNFYAAPRGNFSRFLRFVATGFPILLRKNGKYFLLGWCLFFLPMLITWGVIQAQPSLASSILPVEQLEMMEEMYESPSFAEDVGKQNDDPDEQLVVEGFFDQRSIMAGFYVKNNVGIALRCFAIGILLGIGTAYVLLFNGVVIGATAGYIVSAGHGENFLSFVVTHGSFELTAIAVSGAAGLMLGDAILHRGNRSLGESLRVRGNEAVQVAAGAAIMLFVAAGIEAFWSPAPIAPSIKYAVGLVAWVFVYVWLLLAGNEKLGGQLREA